MGFFGQIDGALQRKIWKLLETPTFASFSKLCLDFYYCWWVLKTFKFWFFFGKRDVFLEKHLKVFKNTKHGYFLLECFSKVFFCWCNLKTFKIWIFWKNNVFLCKKNLIFQKSLTLANRLQIASPIVFLRKSSQNVQNLFFFLQKKIECWKNVLKNFKNKEHG